VRPRLRRCLRKERSNGQVEQGLEGGTHDCIALFRQRALSKSQAGKLLPGFPHSLSYDQAARLFVAADSNGVRRANVIARDKDRSQKRTRLLLAA
jgi:hypothetical protein